MVIASGRWLGVRLDLLATMLISAVSLAAVLVSQDAGKCICKVNQNWPKKNDTPFSLRDPEHTNLSKLLPFIATKIIYPIISPIKYMQ